MNALSTFVFEDKPLRLVDRDGEPWFVGKDVCRALDLRNHNDALEKLDDDEKGVALTDTLGGAQEMIVVSEPGLYRLVFKSRKPEAERFKRWIAHEVLPQIRRTGAYAVPAREDRPVPLDLTARNLQIVTEARLIHGRAYAARLWQRLGLPDDSNVPPSRDQTEAAACLAHLLAMPWKGSTLGELLRGHFQADKAAQAKLTALRMRLYGDGFTVPNIHGEIAAHFAGTRWERPFEHLRRLPDADKGRLGGRSARAETFLPSTVLDLA